MSGDGIKLIGKGEGYEGLYLFGIEEWSQFLGGCNWYTFHPILIEVEDDRLMGGLEASFVLLGLGFRVRWNYRATETVTNIKQTVADMQAGRIETVPWPGDPSPPHTQDGEAE